MLARSVGLLLFASVVGASAQVGAAAAAAGQQTYIYDVIHAKYGNIGTYQRTVDQSDAVTQVHSKLTIKVKVMGMVVHREQTEQIETWRDGRFVSFQSTTDTGGKRTVISGQAQGDKFLVTTPSGTVTAPGDIAAADPLTLNRPGHAEVVSIKSGHIDQAEVAGSQPDTVMLGGVSTPARHFRVSTPTQADRWDVWLDEHGAPVKFRSFEQGAAIDFVLTAPPS